jgi:hypothetical protein
MTENWMFQNCGGRTRKDGINIKQQTWWLHRRSLPWPKTGNVWQLEWSISALKKKEREIWRKIFI